MLKPWWIIPGVVLFTLPRLPLGYGLDGDAARSILSADRLVHSGVYVPSRFPGNPVFEVLLAPLAALGGSPWLTNGVVLLLFFVAIRGFQALARELDHGVLLTVGFAFTPLLLVNAATTMDYIPGLAAIIWAYWAARNRMMGMAAVLAITATGFRPVNILFAAILAVYVFRSRKQVKDAVVFMSVVAGASLLLYVPSILQVVSGLPSMAPAVSSFKGYLLFTAHNGVKALGIPATLALLVFVPKHAKTLWRRRADGTPVEKAQLDVEVATVLGYGALFLLHGHEPEYLIPAIPFLYLLVGRCFPSRSLAIVLGCVFLFGLVQVQVKGGPSGERVAVFRPGPGIVVHDYTLRRELQQLRDTIHQKITSEPAVLMTGMGIILTSRNTNLVSVAGLPFEADEEGVSERESIHKVVDKEVYLVYAMSRENVVRGQRAGFEIYAFSFPAPAICMHRYGYRPMEAGVHLIENADF